MFSQRGTLRKGLGALLALKWLFTSVYSIMTTQMGIVSKGFGAFQALKWLFTSVQIIVVGRRKGINEDKTSLRGQRSFG
uniref:Putative c2h2-type zn-finger protein n=1 Tax=Ixodes ricinus TaxID=34613 RepID=A0A0K8R6D1_IXORI